MYVSDGRGIMGMKIKVLIPNSSEEFRDSQIMERKKVALPGTEVEVVYLLHLIQG